MLNTAPQILVIEDEHHIRGFIRRALESENYQVHEAATYAHGWQQLQQQSWNLVILDLGLPDKDGASLIGLLRAWSTLPILVLSARSADQDKIHALDHGADDYLTKPFSTGELLARVRALLRRSQFKGQAEQTIIRFGEFEINIKDRRMTRGSQLIHLTPIEFQLLRVLVLNAGRVLTHRQLLSEVWGNAYIESNHYLRVYIGHLRQKLELDPSQPQHLLTETGIGYRFQL